MLFFWSKSSDSFNSISQRGAEIFQRLSSVFLSSLPPPRPKDAMRALKKRLCGNKNYREVMLALTVRRCESGSGLIPRWEHPNWATTWTPSSFLPPLCRFWKPAWKTVATGFMSRWPTGTSWTACWSKSSPLKITLLQSCKTRCCRSYRYQSSAPFVCPGCGSAGGDSHAGSLHLYVRVLCVYHWTGVGRRVQKQPRSYRCGPHLRGT